MENAASGPSSCLPSSQTPRWACSGPQNSGTGSCSQKSSPRSASQEKHAGLQRLGLGAGLRLALLPGHVGGLWSGPWPSRDAGQAQSQVGGTRAFRVPLGPPSSGPCWAQRAVCVQQIRPIYLPGEAALPAPCCWSGCGVGPLLPGLCPYQRETLLQVQGEEDGGAGRAI